MKTKILKTEQEYNEACQRIYSLIQSTNNPILPESPEGEEMELLSLLVENYEQEKFPSAVPDAIEAIKFRMEQLNLKQSDIAPLFGGKTRVSEVLNGKRTLTLKMIVLLHNYLGIQLESLVNNKGIKLEAENREKLLSISSIREYLTNKRTAMF